MSDPQTSASAAEQPSTERQEGVLGQAFRNAGLTTTWRNVAGRSTEIATRLSATSILTHATEIGVREAIALNLFGLAIGSHFGDKAQDFSDELDKAQGKPPRSEMPAPKLCAEKAPKEETVKKPVRQRIGGFFGNLFELGTTKARAEKGPDKIDRVFAAGRHHAPGIVRHTSDAAAGGLMGFMLGHSPATSATLAATGIAFGLLGRDKIEDKMDDMANAKKQADAVRDEFSRSSTANQQAAITDAGPNKQRDASANPKRGGSGRH